MDSSADVIFARATANVILTAIGHNLRIVLAWLRLLPLMILNDLMRLLAATPALKSAS